MVKRVIRGRITGFRKEKKQHAGHETGKELILEITVEPVPDGILSAFVLINPEVTISIMDGREKDE